MLKEDHSEKKAKGDGGADHWSKTGSCGKEKQCGKFIVPLKPNGDKGYKYLWKQIWTAVS